MKKLLFCLTLLSMFFLTACNSQQETGTVLKFSSWGSRTEYSILKQIIAQYEKLHPGIKIKFIHVPENYFRKLHLLFASNTEPDVIFVNNTYAPLYIDAGLLDDLSGKFDESAFFKSSLDCFRKNGKLYAVPRDISGLVLYVNKTELLKLGINPYNINSLQDLKSAAENISNHGKFALNFERDSLFWLPYLEYFNGGILSDDTKKIIFNTPESIKGLDFYASLIKQGCIPSESDMSGMTSAQMFINGKILMYLSGRWVVPKFRETVKFDWDIIEFPQSNTSKTLIDSSGWAVSASSLNKDLACDFINYLSGCDVSKTFTESGLITPARIDVAESSVFTNINTKPFHSRAFTDALQNSKPTPVNSKYAKINDEIRKATEPLFNGSSSASDIMTPGLLKKLDNYLK